MLFAEIEDQKHYEFCILGPEQAEPDFGQISNIFHPRTVDESVAHDGVGVVPGIKTNEDSWDLRGHRSRIVRISNDVLTLFASLYDAPGTAPREARLPLVHSVEILEVLGRFAQVPRTLGSLREGYFSTEHFHETNAQKEGTIQRLTRVAAHPTELIVSGPHFYSANPFNKTPNEDCKHNQDYSAIDLTQISVNYLPRTNYVPACTPGEYRARTPHWNGVPVTEYFRHVHRKMLAPTGERTLISAIISPGPGTLLTAISTAFKKTSDMVRFAGLTASIPMDFLIKTTGKADLTAGAVGLLPFPEESWATSRFLVGRALRLNCLTTHYGDLWQEVTTKDIAKDGFAKQDPRLPSWQHLTPKWTRESALRTPYERRQALVELDALAALSLGLTVEQLLLIYRVQFPVLQQYERETYYDQRGKIVFTTNRGLSGVGLDRKQWEEVQHAQAGDKLPPWAKDAGGPFIPPFDSCDREADMTQAYRHFQEKLALHAVDDLPTVIPNVSDTDYAKLFVWALLHASGGMAILLDLARAFALRADPKLVKRLAPRSHNREVKHWVSTVGLRSVKTGLLRSTLSELTDRGGVLPGADREGRATVSTSPHTAAPEKIHPWIRFEADLVMSVLRSQPEERRTVIDESLPAADRTLLENSG